MKKTLCVVLAAIVLLAAYVILRPKNKIYPYLFSSDMPRTISTSYQMPLNFNLFREYKGEAVTVKVYAGKSSDGTDGKTPLAVYEKSFKQKVNTIEDIRFVWDTPAEPGDYFVEYTTSYFGNQKWEECPDKNYEDFSVIYPCEEHTFVENENSVYGAKGKKSDCHTHGTAYRLCSVCGFEEMFELDFSHVYGSSVTVSNASCVDNGYKTYKCTKCEETKVEVILADNNMHRIRAVVKIEPTATRPGSVWFECSSCNYVEPYQTEIPALFMDINPAMYYEMPVAWAYDNDYFSRIKGYEFVPDNECDRAIAFSLMYLANDVGVLPEDVNHFSDVKAGDYYMDATRWAYKFGIIKDDLFRPFDACTRAEIVEYLWRMKKRPKVRYKHQFTDIPKGATYSDAVSWAVSNGIVSGVSETEFDPEGKCTEAQVITFLYRTMNEGKAKENDYIG